jgi:CRISPR-associated protein Csb2
LGLAIAIPRGVEGEESFRDVMGAFLFDESGGDKEIHLWKDPSRAHAGPKIWDWDLKRSKPTGYEPRAALQMKQWTEASRVWASVTPVVLHHYPKKSRDGDVAEIVGEAFVSAGLPKPIAISVQPVSYFRGAGHARNIPEFHEGGERLCRYQTHVMAEFANRVEGPVLVGRGRFRGYGLCRPVRNEETDGDARFDGE